MAFFEPAHAEFLSSKAAPFKIDEFLHDDVHRTSRSPSISRSATPPISTSPVSRDVLNRIDGRPSPRAVDMLRTEGARPRALSNPPPVKTPLHKILESEDEGESSTDGAPGPATATRDTLAPTYARTQSMDSTMRRRAGSFLSPLQRGYSVQMGERP